jgi:hypothetical protein
MKRKPPIPGKIAVPEFASAAEETEWWHRNRHFHDQIFLAAVKRGEAQVLTKEKLLERIRRRKGAQ